MLDSQNSKNNPREEVAWCTDNFFVILQNKQIHQHDTQQKDYFYTYIVNSEIGKRAIKHTGGRLWNNLPQDIKIINSLSLFKQKLKTYLLQSLEKRSNSTNILYN